MPRLLERVVQLRRRHGEERETAGDETDADPEHRIAMLERRLERLEALLEGLQDSVHREAVRHDKEMQELCAKIQPAEIARSLARHNREHGL